MRGKGALREKVGDTRGEDGAPSGRKWRLGVLREKVGVWGPQGRKRGWGGSAHTPREPRGSAPGLSPACTLTLEHGCLVETRSGLGRAAG